ncbi:hypothetical protein [Streptomyces sp. NPDC006668]|uniref:hypothetical protein n=1 Tax=Streptomyces sp. NPDC006668 TaxID=3156903 RepID=UPI0033D8C6A8
MQDTPGGPIPASVLQQLSGKGLHVRLLGEFLAEHRFLEDDLPVTIQAWFARTTNGLPEPMHSQIASWFTTRLGGRTTPPRSQARSPLTMRHHLRFALPVLTRLAAAGLNDLTHVTAAALRAHLAACHLTGSDYINTASALRTVFTFLHTHHGAPRNPACHLRVGHHQRPLPLPAGLAPVRDALTSPTPPGPPSPPCWPSTPCACRRSATSPSPTSTSTSTTCPSAPSCSPNPPGPACPPTSPTAPRPGRAPPTRTCS